MKSIPKTSFDPTVEYHDDVHEEDHYHQHHSYHDSEFELLVKTFLHDSAYSSRIRAISQLIYSILNAGLLALPVTVAQSGIVLYIGVVLIAAVCSGYTSFMVVNMADEQKVRTLESLGDKAFGSKGYYLVSICQILYSFSLMCVTLAIWSDMMSDVFRDFVDKSTYPILCGRRGQAFIGALIVLPLCLFARSIASLRLTPLLTITAIVSCLIVIVLAFLNDNFIDKQGKYHYTYSMESIKPQANAWIVAFVVPFCYSFNQKAFTVYSCLRRRNPSRWKYSLVRALIIVTIIYLAFGLFGYFTCRFDKLSLKSFNYFNDFKSVHHDLLVTDIIRIVVATSLLLTFPVDCLVAASSFRRLFYRYYAANAMIPNYKVSMTPNTTNIPSSASPTRKYSDSSDWSYSTFRESKNQPWFCYCLEFLCCFGFMSERRHSSMSMLDKLDGVDVTTTPNQHPLLGDEEENISPTEKDISINPTHSSSESGSGSDDVLKAWDFDHTTSTPILIANNRSLSLNLPLSASTTPNPSTKYAPIPQDDPSMSPVRSISKSAMYTPAPIAIKTKHHQHRHNVNSNASTSSADTKSTSSIGSVANSDELLDKCDRKLSTGMNRNQLKFQSDSLTMSVLPVPQDEFQFQQREKHRLEHDQILYKDQNNLSNSSRRYDTGIMSCMLKYCCGIYPTNYNKHSDHSRTVSTTYLNLQWAGAFPALLFWMLGIAICMILEEWTIIAGTVGAFATAILVYILPSMLYFRLGFAKDFQTIPICGIIPNRAYMLIIQTIGVLLLLGNAALFTLYYLDMLP